VSRAAAPPRPDPLEQVIAAALDRRLDPTSRRPLALALSGGGDSLALLLVAHAWAARSGRPLRVLTVDHRLQPQSGAWTEACAAHAARLGLPFEALAWTGPKPQRGLPAAGRAARHRLLAEAARRAGARAILLGHTADDVLEARAMRQAGAATPEPREWAPSPIWPEGRGLFLLRPMLAVRRGALRDWLAARGEHWIDDPANADPRFARARARAGLDAGAPDPVAGDGPFVALARLCTAGAGALGVARAALRTVSPEEARRFVGLAAVCAGGGARLPASATLDRLAVALRGEAPVASTLAGARTVADADEVLFVREAGEAARGGLAPTDLPAGRAVVWDGRFEVEAAVPGLQIRRLAGLAARLPPAERRALAAVPAAARPALPAIVEATGAVGCPLLAPRPDLRLSPLIHQRLLAAAGLVAREPP